jgi:hypothetical protein
LALCLLAVTSIVDALPNGCMERRGDEHIYVVVIWASLQNSQFPARSRKKNSQLPSSGAEDSCERKETRWREAKMEW